ncbi:unnamed protein product [Lactuca virosa]|uniref:Uncharacterized protein n=1 Tax=Lactuca virosa TaxID=75947 RepID=A0AAU9NAL1_9ASTR|nr:unnamed protein product [Lactuca virosa]
MTQAFGSSPEIPFHQNFPVHPPFSPAIKVIHCRLPYSDCNPPSWGILSLYFQINYEGPTSKIQLAYKWIGCNLVLLYGSR